jgi:hypothetical protein
MIIDGLPSITHVVLIQVFAFLLSGLSPEARGELVWETKEVFRKASPFDKEVAASFPFRNTGTEPITIKSVRSACGCMVPKIRNMVIHPGETGEITAVFALEHRIGKQKRPIAVEFADPARSRIGLYLHVDIPEVIKPSASFLRWVREEALAPKKLSVSVHEEYPIQALNAFSKDKRLDIKVSRDGAQGLYAVEVLPRAEGQPIAAVVTLESTLPGDLRKRRDFYVWVE